MKNYKFRAWLQGEYDMEFVYFSLFDNDCDYNIDAGKCLEEGIITQFTGMKDSLGADIYEGDILKHHKGIGVVWYRENIAAFVVSGDDGSYQLTRGEKIGNKFENPELMQELSEQAGAKMLDGMRKTLDGFGLKPKTKE